MKKILAVLIVSLNVMLVSCLDTEEKIIINQDNSGLYQLNADMSSMMDQLKAFKPNDVKALEGNKDTTIQFKSYTDTLSTLTAEEKALLEKGSLHILINDDSGQMKMSVEVPFKDAQQLLYLKQHLTELVGKLNLEKNFTGDKDISQAGGGMPDNMFGSSGSMLNPVQNAFTFSIDKNIISNTLTDSSSVKAGFEADSSMQMIKQLIPFLGDLTYKTTFVLPSPVKKYTGGGETLLSDDKKTISFTTTLTSLMEKPSELSYTVEY